jgi:hypothetical protein
MRLNLVINFIRETRGDQRGFVWYECKAESCGKVAGDCLRGGMLTGRKCRPSASPPKKTVAPVRDKEREGIAIRTERVTVAGDYAV